jgi:tryptophan-rich sensory protein
MHVATKTLGLFGWLALAFLTAAVGAAASVSAGSFYAELTRPAWAPPAWLFGPVWTVLYAMMGVAAWLVWLRSGLSGAKLAFALFVIQLVANALWSWLFFQWRLGALAFVEVLILWSLILATIVAFWRVRKSAAVLLIPYLGWVTFASILTFAMWRLNPELLG